MKKLRIVWKIVAGVLVIIVCIYFVSATLKFKYWDGVLPMEDIYNYPEDTIDVLLVGSSHMGINVDAAELWDDQGIASYCVWGAYQPMWNSYYDIVEVLKTQKPRLIVLETYGMLNLDEYVDYASRIKNTMGMRFSINKINAVKTSCPEEEWGDMILEIPTYHSRYSELTKDDFEHYFWQKDLVNKHTVLINNTVEFETPDVSEVEERGILSEKQIEYFEKIVKLASDNDIDLLLITTPYALKEEEQAQFNSIADLANKYSVPYINYNLYYDEIGLDFSNDLSDEGGGHLNGYGARKVSKSLAEYIENNYEIPDRRGDKSYSSWEEFSEQNKAILAK